MPDMSIRRTSLEMSSHLSPNQLKPVLRGSRNDRFSPKRKEKPSISIHPFSFSSFKN